MKTYFSIPAPRHGVLWLMLTAAMFVFSSITSPVLAGDRDKIREFLNVTGFDVSLDSIALSAKSAPNMLGMDPKVFGPDWRHLTEDVFDTDVMRTIALDILEATLEDDLLNHAVAFYASELGQRLVVVENASHMLRSDEGKAQTGKDIVADLADDNPDRLAMFKRMNLAIDASGTSLRAMQEIQIRFLLAATAAGVIELRVDADELRAMIKSQEGEARVALEKSALQGAAYTYRDFSDEDVEAYTIALEQKNMQQVYELLNAVQYEIMANRFEVLASRMTELGSGQDI
ncbi:MAG: DUF2059 domain-containing protein [Rhodobacteraceae bacterium]|nr:DUF2059 domain-containing protein [Paracoccaceae bacterium]